MSEFTQFRNDQQTDEMIRVSMEAYNKDKKPQIKSKSSFLRHLIREDYMRIKEDV